MLNHMQFIKVGMICFHIYLLLQPIILYSSLASFTRMPCYFGEVEASASQGFEVMPIYLRLFALFYCVSIKGLLLKFLFV